MQLNNLEWTIIWLWIYILLYCIVACISSVHSDYGCLKIYFSISDSNSMFFMSNLSIFISEKDYDKMYLSTVLMESSEEANLNMF